MISRSIRWSAEAGVAKFRGAVVRKLFFGNAEYAERSHAEFAESSLRTLRLPQRSLRFKKTIPKQLPFSVHCSPDDLPHPEEGRGYRRDFDLQDSREPSLCTMTFGEPMGVSPRTTSESGS